MKDFFKFIGIILLGCAIFAAITSLIWGWKYVTAPVRGMVNAEQRLESAPSRIANFNHFYDLCASIVSYDEAIAAQERQLERSEQSNSRERILSNIAGLEAQRIRAINQYNQDARKSYTQARFLAEDLPRNINPNQENITCNR